MVPSVVPLSVVPNPPSGTMGSSITLDIWGFPERVLSYVWYRISSGTLIQIAAYSVPSGMQMPADIRERVLPNGSLLIPNLTLSDMGGYVVQIVNFTSGEATMAQGYLPVYEEISRGQGDDSSNPGWAFIVIVTGVYLVLALVLILFTVMTGRGCEHNPTEVKSSTSNHGHLL
ncbi:cell adhesion molecule CEACAM4-like [Macrotis lagotis]|uniref:cell adhesion molecule CEACAM4-like n=1 Tax=Macrotis lagotis TaxID=92651 RepID=UPI003D691738